MSTHSTFRSPTQTPTKYRTKSTTSPNIFKSSPTPQLRVPSSRSRANSDDSAGGIEERRRQISCDVILDGIDRHEDGQFVDASWVSEFLATLGTRLYPICSKGSENPPTPSKPLRVDPFTVINALRELAATETSYLTKISTLHEKYEVPLRELSMVGGPISAVQADNLFGNLPSLINIATAFNDALDYIVQDIEEDALALPMFGETILLHVERMKPFGEWLSNNQIRQRTVNALKRNEAAMSWITRRDLITSDLKSGTGVSFTMLIGEPFQRVSRYGLLLSVVIRHLSDDDPNLFYLEQAVKLLGKICSMDKEGELLEKSILWALNEVVTDLPSSFVSTKRKFIGCIDLDEKVSFASSETGLETSLFLFSDSILLVKRNHRGGEAKKLAGLDDLENLILLYENFLSGGASGAIGKRLKSRRMGYRGLFMIQDVSLIDMGGLEVGMILKFPPKGLSERWNGRPNRLYSVSSPSGTGHGDYTRLNDKSTFLALFGQTKCSDRAREDWYACKGNAISEPKEEGIESTRIFFGICQRKHWDVGFSKKSGFILHLSKGDFEVSELKFVEDAVVVRGLVLGNMIRLESRGKEMRIVEFSKLVPALIAISAEEDLFNFPLTIPNLSPVSSHRSRPRSLLTGAADVLSSSLKRAQSGVSATSSFASSRSSVSRISSHTVERVVVKETNQLRGVKSSIDMKSRRRMSIEIEEAEGDTTLSIENQQQLRRMSSLPLPPLIFSPARYAATPESPIFNAPLTSPRRLKGPRAPTPQMDLFSPLPKNLPSPTRSPERMSIDLDLTLDAQEKLEEDSDRNKRFLTDLSPRASPPKRITPTQRIPSYENVTLSRPKSLSGLGSKRGKRIGSREVGKISSTLLVEKENEKVNGLIGMQRSPKIGNLKSTFFEEESPLKPRMDSPTLNQVNEGLKKTFGDLNQVERERSLRNRKVETELSDSKKEVAWLKTRNGEVESRNSQLENLIRQMQEQTRSKEVEYRNEFTRIDSKAKEEAIKNRHAHEDDLIKLYNFCEVELATIEKTFKLPEPAIELGKKFKQVFMERNTFKMQVTLLEEEKGSLQRELQFEKSRRDC